MAETDIKIKDAPISNSINGNVKFPVSDGSDLPRSATFNQVHSYVKDTLKSEAEFALKSDLPTKTSQLVNDSGFAKTTDIPTKTEISSAIAAAVDEHNSSSTAHAALIRSIAKEEVAKAYESFGIRWSLDDTVKTIEYVGNTALVEKFKNWVDTSSKPCEIKKDGSDFAYLTNTSGIASSTNWATREDGSASHYQTEDKADYLQMVELSNINLSSSINQLDRTMTVWFNTDTTCPNGFHRWFKAGKKLFARYDSTFNADGSTIDACYGTSHPTGDWSLSSAHQLTKATNANLMNITAWEIICLSWIQAAYYQTFDMQTALAGGLQSGSGTAARGYINGSTDTLTTPHGKISSGAFRFMYLENAFWGKQWLAGFGWRGQAGTGYLTFDDEKANKAAILALEDADVTMSYPTNCNGTYCKNVDFFTMPIEAGGSSTKGFYDGNWSSQYDDRMFYAGGDSSYGLACGAFARYLNISAGGKTWGLRARCAMNR